MTTQDDTAVNSDTTQTQQDDNATKSDAVAADKAAQPDPKTIVADKVAESSGAATVPPVSVSLALATVKEDTEHADAFSLWTPDLKAPVVFVVFANTASDISFLAITKCIAIEIHDEFNCREAICKILKNYGFSLFNSGELTIGVNQNWINK